jgi:membrane-bound serine protease (ClpP class)
MIKYHRRPGWSGVLLLSWAVVLSVGVSAAQVPDSQPAEIADDATRRGVIVTIDSDISDVTFESIERRVDEAREAGADVIIFEMDTPGGMVTSALDICDFIKGLDDVKTVAWVHAQAYSAGSMISLACDEIVMSSRSTIGDCGVILGGPTGPQAVPDELRAKAEAPVLAEFRESATRHGYDRLLCESMVIKEREVWWVENIDTGERRFVDTEKKEKLLGEDEADAEADMSPVAVSWKLVTRYIDPLSGNEAVIDNPVVSANELLTMTQSEAYAFGFAAAIVSDEPELQARYNLADDLTRLTFSGLERFTGWMTSMPVRVFLLIIILLGAYVEFNTPGVGVPGLVALIALGIFVGAPYMTGLANTWELLIIALGVVLLAVELFVIPGFGVAGILGIVFVLVGVLATFIPEEPGRDWPVYWPSLDQSFRGLEFGVKTLAIGLVGGLVGAIALSKYLHRIPLLKLAAPESPTPATVEIADPYRGAAQVGDIGIAETPLHPGGSARFGATLVDVVTEGEFLEAGVEVEVIERRGNNVLVRKTPS